jgi:transposase
MSKIHVLGIDLGKSNFHVCAFDSSSRILFKKKLSRKQLIDLLASIEQTIVAFESCGGAHWLARKCEQLGHQSKLIPPQYVKPYVKTNKNDFVDAEAIAEASTRPNMRFVRAKTEEQQVISVCHRIRSGYVTERTAVMSRIGATLLEFGLALPVGHAKMKALFSWIAQQRHIELPPLLLRELELMHRDYLHLNDRIAEQDQKIKAWSKQNECCELVKSIPGVGDMLSTSLVMEVGDAKQFKNGREMAAWLGLVPAQCSTGGKQKLLGISKRGNKSLRCLFVHGARAMMSRLGRNNGPYDAWLTRLRASKPFNVACIALANKLARIAWAVLTTKTPFTRTAF